MKNGLMLFLCLCLIELNLAAQNNVVHNIPLIGETAPSFVAETTEGTLNFPADYGNQWKIIFSHPRDFTPVCSSEVFELAQLQPEFSKLGVKLVVLSTDDLAQHKLWKSSLEELTYKNRPSMKIHFPLVDDKAMSISKSYGMLHTVASSTKDVRGVFIINPQNKVEAIFFYPMNIGRNMEEIKRTIVALQSVGNGKERMLTPANWQAGEDMMVPQFPYTQDQLKKQPELSNDYYNVGSFMWFKKAGSELVAK